MLDAFERKDLRAEPLAGGDRVAVTGQRDFVLTFSRDTPLLAGNLHVLAHRQTGGRFPERCGVGMGQRIHSSGDAGFDTAGSNAFRDGRDGAQTRDAVGGHRLRLDRPRQTGFQNDLAGQIGLAGLGDDGAKGDGIDRAGIDVVLFEQTRDGASRQFQGTQTLEGLAGLHKGSPAARDDRNPLAHDLASSFQYERAGPRFRVLCPSAEMFARRCDVRGLAAGQASVQNAGGGYKRMPRERARNFTVTSISRPSRTIVSVTVSPPAFNERACDMTR